MIKIMFRKSFKRALRRAEDEGYDRGYAKGREDLKQLGDYLKAKQELLFEREDRLEKITREKLIKTLKDHVVDLLNEGLDDATRDIEFQLIDEAEETVEARKQEAVPENQG